MELILKNVRKKHLQVLRSLAEALGFEIGVSKEENEKTSKGFDATAFSGTVKFEGNPIEIQRKLRDEWG